MTLQLVEPRPRYIDRRPRQAKRPSGRCERKFECMVTGTSRPGRTQNQAEQDVADALKLLGLVSGIEDVQFRIIRQRGRNGKLGWKIPDFVVITRKRVYALEVSEDFSQDELDALGFVEDRYGVAVIMINHEQAAAMAADARVLAKLLSNADARHALHPDTPFRKEILTAASDTAARRRKYERKQREGAAGASKTQRAPHQYGPTAIPAGLLAASKAYALTRAQA